MSLKKLFGLVLGGAALQMGKRAVKSDSVADSAIYTAGAGILGKVSYDIMTEEEEQKPIDREYDSIRHRGKRIA